MICHVAERVRASGLFADVIVATDDRRIRDAVVGCGHRAVMTSPDHKTGTDRVAEVARGLDADVIVNVQGDEPLIPHEVLRAVLAPFDRDPAPQMTTVATRFRSLAEFLSPNQGKVVVDRSGRALYFTRAPIPFSMADAPAGHAGAAPGPALKTIGIYGYSREFLFTFAGLAPTPLEAAERLEQLRALEHGYTIHVGFSEEDTFGVDTPEDLERVRALMEGAG